MKGTVQRATVLLTLAGVLVALASCQPEGGEAGVGKPITVTKPPYATFTTIPLPTASAVSPPTAMPTAQNPIVSATRAPNHPTRTPLSAPAPPSATARASLPTALMKYTQLAIETKRDGDYEVYLVSLTGEVIRDLTDDHEHDDGAPAWSPDGQRLCFTKWHGGLFGTNVRAQGDIFVINRDGSNERRITTNPAHDGWCTWSPDGQHLAFKSKRTGNLDIFTIDLRGGQATNLTNNPANDDSPAWSPDGRRIAFHSSRDGNKEIYVMDADGGNPTNLTRNPADDFYPTWSPDGSHIAFISDRDGNREIYLMRADGSDARRMTFNDYVDSLATWSPDGRYLAYYAKPTWEHDKETFIMDIETGATWQVTHNEANDEYTAWSPWLR